MRDASPGEEQDSRAEGLASGGVAPVHEPVVCLTGASGFIGSHVRRLLEQPTSGVRLRLLARTPGAAEPSPGGAETRIGDLGDPRSLSGVAEGAEVLVHCAPYVGGSAEMATRTNVAGTRALLTEAVQSGVRRIVYVSTAGVYGRGPFRGGGHESLAVAPASALSRSRAEAERLVLDAGGTVLRPHLVYGTGDKWVGPRALRLARLLHGRVQGFGAVVSMVDVRRLAEATVRVASSPSQDVPARIYDCNHPAPVRAADCMGAFMHLAGMAISPEHLSPTQARGVLRDLGEPSHDLDMLAVDHWFDSARLWTDLQLDPGPHFLAALPDHRAWYFAYT